MRLIIILFLLSISQISIAQRQPNFWDTTRKFEQQHLFDSALFYYRIHENKYSNKTSWPYWSLEKRIADCLVKQNKLTDAKVIYQGCIKWLQSKTSHPFSYNDSADIPTWVFEEVTYQLCDIFNGEKKYDSAIYLLNWHKQYYASFEMHDQPGANYAGADFHYRYAESLYGKSLLDSAINCLTPYMFFSIRGLYNSSSKDIDSVKNINMGEFYLKLLRKKYSTKQIRDSLNNSIENIFYSNEQEKWNNNKNWRTIKCYLIFLNNKVELMHLTVLLDGDAENEYSKEYLLADLKNSYLYKMIF